MDTYTNTQTGIEFPISELEVFKEEDGWIVLKHPAQDAYLSVQFCNHFFNTLDEADEYLQKEIQVVADANDLYQLVGINRKSNIIITAEYSQYINNITHLVYIGIKLQPGNNGYWFMAVTKDEVMVDFPDPMFMNSNKTTPNLQGQTDKATEAKLAGHTLQYLHGYNSNTPGGGGTSTEKYFILNPDHSFRYQYKSFVSFGSMGGNTSQDEGWGSMGSTGKK